MPQHVDIRIYHSTALTIPFAQGKYYISVQSLKTDEGQGQHFILI